ncbi:TetR/AcrR family transcriptional regulator [Paenirhodobacter populi]|uniref:TetR/AcrR family transcriptional regulator n=1 Tax=Paenirhodobacter populi TaxID=2306993 RepID=A0A443JG53_9RHOB|nr:TetR/AcrR family transcriptional regulator [Sinirhodobacter populi]RWR19545.1 TetR/AcrR family transcriptional regulator [Sinirhodobacter populi]
MKQASRITGRPRGFDREKAVETAMTLFRRHGYEGVSLAMLTDAIGIAPPSLYAAFGSKAGLYAEALDLYAGRARHVALPKEQGLSLDQALLRFFASAIEHVRDARQSGCMISTGMLECHPDHAGLAADLSRRREAMQACIEQDLAFWLPPDDAAQLAPFVCAILQGISVQARDGASVDQLRGIASRAVRSLAT